MITYNDIYEAARKERYSEPLQHLPKNYIEEVSDYIKEKKEIASKDDDIFSEVIVKTKKQLENAQTLFKELMRTRRKKILSLVLIAAETGISKQDFENMLVIEKELFEEIMKNIDACDKSIIEKMIGKREEESKTEMILFTSGVDEFLGLEGEKIGPFEKGQIANLPKEISRILVADGKAEVIEKE
ncbi:hypothetical protein COU57_02035 [Candidatus Pacearchaeota archaeon CG10_big_fil_rev_8_21_14_0_10_32_14]|nr:MAG: hypothetical protein COU57_02035 [Candidatus Pacearchaeota archaeon CG10_big_fil_rev_8_21_14_0_10_32_14]